MENPATKQLVLLAFGLFYLACLFVSVFALFFYSAK